MTRAQAALIAEELLAIQLGSVEDARALVEDDPLLTDEEQGMINDELDLLAEKNA